MESIPANSGYIQIASLEVSQGAMTDGIVTFDSESDHPRIMREFKCRSPKELSTCIPLRDSDENSSAKHGSINTYGSGRPVPF
jgi:hypothetical protein